MKKNRRKFVMRWKKRYRMKYKTVQRPCEWSGKWSASADGKISSPSQEIFDKRRKKSWECSVTAGFDVYGLCTRAPRKHNAPILSNNTRSLHFTSYTRIQSQPLFTYRLFPMDFCSSLAFLFYLIFFLSFRVSLLSRERFCCLRKNFVSSFAGKEMFF